MDEEGEHTLGVCLHESMDPWAYTVALDSTLSTIPSSDQLALQGTAVEVQHVLKLIQCVLILEYLELENRCMQLPKTRC